ncbi:hypothetical protein CKO51_21310 [Rhodopirellula sp. SM50]|nr:hypothetical protein CKO51_21310 [Rhodopirellula sp. SM50]
MTQVARELGCRAVEISQVCTTLDIPKPYSGYWSKLAHRKSPEQTPLPENDDPAKQSLTFFKHPEFGTRVGEPPRELQYGDDILKILALARRLDPVKVPKTLRRPHKLVASARDQITADQTVKGVPWGQRSRFNVSRGGSTLSIDVSEDLTSRALRVYDVLIKRIEKLGGKVEVRKSGYDGRSWETVVVIAGEDVTTVRIREKRKQVKVTNEDATYSWERSRTDLLPTGLLLIDRGATSFEQVYLKDTEKKKLDDGLNDFIISLVKQAGEKRVRRRKQEEERARREEAARIEHERQAELKRRQDELQERQAQEQAKVDELWLHANSRSRSKLIREYLSDLAYHLADEDCSLPIEGPTADYLRWAHQQADRLDPLCPTPPSVLDETIDAPSAGPNRPR